jgi:hypothetical protein
MTYEPRHEKRKDFPVRFSFLLEISVWEDQTLCLANRATGGVFNNERGKGKRKMEKIGEEFLQRWDEFEAAVFQNTVFQKIQPPLDCKDAVLIVKNSGLFKLNVKQVTLLEHLRDIREIIAKNGIQSVSITTEEVDTLKQIITSIKESC